MDLFSSTLIQQIFIQQLIWKLNFIMLTCQCSYDLLKPFFFHKVHQDNMSVSFIPPYTPLLYSKIGVYRAIQYFLIFALKHRFWVLIRTASMRRFYCVPTINVLNKNKKNIRIFHLKINIFTAVKYFCILHGRVCVM